eukprot:2835741-Prymnesium_polylepis.1
MHRSARHRGPPATLVRKPSPLASCALSGVRDARESRGDARRRALASAARAAGAAGGARRAAPRARQGRDRPDAHGGAQPAVQAAAQAQEA